MPTSHRALTLALCALAAVLLLGSAPLRAQQEGSDYRKVTPPQPSASPGKITVIEFFSYGCPHCAHFYPLVESWRTKLPKDVIFRRVPVGFERPAWVNLQRAYYALQSSGELDKLDGALFRAIHEQNQQLVDEASIADWVGRSGGNADKFSADYVSFGVNNQTVQADKMAQDYGIDTIPAMAVDGEYVAMADPAPGEMPYLGQLLANTDKLIARVRAERAATRPTAKSK